MLRVASVLWACLAFCLPASAQSVDWRECNMDGTAKQEDVAEMQLLVRNVGCLKLDGRFVQETDGVDKLWGHGSSGRLNSCSGNRDFTSGFNGFLNRSKQVGKYKVGMSVATIKRTLFDGWDDSRGDDLNADCRPQRIANRPNNPSGSVDKCEFPKSAEKWLDSLDKTSKPPANTANTANLSRLSSTLHGLEVTLKSYLSRVPEPLANSEAAIKATRLGIYQKYLIARIELLENMEKVIKSKNQLAKYGAILDNGNPTCMNCILLADFDLLMSISVANPLKNGQRELVGRHRAGGRQIRINMADLDFVTLKESHTTIQDWSKTLKDFEDTKQSLLTDSTNAAQAAALVKTATEAERAKLNVLVKLEGLVRLSPTRSRLRPEDSAAYLAANRERFCGSNLTTE